MQSINIYFKVNFTETTKGRNYNDVLWKLIDNIVKNKYKGYTHLESPTKINLSENEHEDIKNVFLKNYSNEFFLIDSVEVGSIDVWVNSKNTNQSATIHSYEIKGIATTKIYNCLAIINESRFVCEHPETHEIISLSKLSSTKVFVAQD